MARLTAGRELPLRWDPRPGRPFQAALRDELRDARLETRLVLQIHDELLFETPDDEVERASEIIVREMAEAFQMDPPLEVDCGVGQNWLEAK